MLVPLHPGIRDVVFDRDETNLERKFGTVYWSTIPCGSMGVIIASTVRARSPTDAVAGCSGPSQVLYLLIADILKTYSSGDAAKALNSALTAERNVAYGIEIFDDYARLMGEVGLSEERMDSPISKHDWEEFRDTLKPLFEEDLDTGEYLRYPKTWSAIRAYAYFSGKDRCKSWVVQSAQEDAGFLLGTATSLLTKTTGSYGTNFNIKEASDVGIYDLEALLPVAQAVEQASVFEGEDAGRLISFIEGATSWLKSPD